MSKYLVFIIPLLFFTACEDTDDEASSSESPFIGTWNFVATEYDTTCTGEGEVFDAGTMVFEENTATFTSSVTFEEWCEGTITDGVCDEYGNIYELSDFEADCAYDGMQFSNSTCYQSTTAEWSYSEPYLYTTVTFTEPIPQEYASICTESGFTYADGLCYISFSDTASITFDGNTVSWNDIYLDEEIEDFSYCDVYVLTKQ